ncbi:MAG: DUF512 domain-containing protein, partial [Deltaproteobacteria bacterium]|nr:DUF512 domain-containing protein [Deltaproteobacteria bacterium]
DLLEQLSRLELGQGGLLPDVMLREGEQVLLDDLTVDDLTRALRVPVVVIDSSPWGILEGLEQLADGPINIIHC